MLTLLIPPPSITMDSYTFLAAITASILGSGAIAAAVTAYAMRKKTNADAEATLSGSILAYTNKLTLDNDKLREAIDKLEDDHEKRGNEIRKLRHDLELSEERAAQLREIVTAMEARKESDRVIIAKLITALRASDPSNPILTELQSLSEFKIETPIPPHPHK